MIKGIDWFPQRHLSGQCWAAIGPRGERLTVRRAPLAADEPKLAGAYECTRAGIIVTRGISPVDAMEKASKITNDAARANA